MPLKCAVLPLRTARYVTRENNMFVCWMFCCFSLQLMVNIIHAHITFTYAQQILTKAIPSNQTKVSPLHVLMFPTVWLYTLQCLVDWNSAKQCLIGIRFCIEHSLKLFLRTDTYLTVLTLFWTNFELQVKSCPDQVSGQIEEVYIMMNTQTQMFKGVVSKTLVNLQNKIQFKKSRERN